MPVEKIDIEISQLPVGEIRQGMRTLMRAVNQLLGADRRSKELEEEVKNMYLSFDRRLRELEEMANEPDIGDGKPIDRALLSFDQLRDVVKANMGSRYSSNFDDLRPLCGDVRDFLAAAFDNVERVNDHGERFDYTASEEKHRDAVVIWLDGEGWILDFCKDVEGGGKLSEKLQWLLIKSAPWDPDGEGNW